VFYVDETENIYGEKKEIIRYKAKNMKYSKLTQQDIKMIDKVITTTKKLFWDQFIDLVYSTYPISTQLKYSELNLVELANKYKEEKKENENKFSSQH